MGHEQCLVWVERKVLEGWEVHSCYEAGVYGYWFGRKLVGLGVKQLVVAARGMGKGCTSPEKTDTKLGRLVIVNGLYSARKMFVRD
jgi:hypothetical protein